MFVEVLIVLFPVHAEAQRVVVMVMTAMTIAMNL
jgi:hypothetical protein